MRVEFGFDPWVNTPDHQTWSHAGHSICISQKSEPASANAGNDKNTVGSGDLLVKALKFGHNRPEIGSKEANKVRKILSRQMNKEKLQDHDVLNYVNALEQLSIYKATLHNMWPKDFLGEEGTGVEGLNKEKRLVC